jgi:hypothetical protein
MVSTQITDGSTGHMAAIIVAKSRRATLPWFRVLIGIFVLLMLCDFVFRGIVPSPSSGRNDFSDPFVGSWLWIHGQNPYDRIVVAAAAKQLTHSSLPVVPIYPLTTYVLVAPFTLLSWNWANLAWTLISGVGIGLIAWTLVRIAKFKISEMRAWSLVGLVVGFTPLHRAIHTENVAIIAIAICLLSVYMADESCDVSTGILLAFATGLKPQLGVWILFFYFVQRRWAIVVSGVLGFTMLLAVACARIPVSIYTLFINYRDDLHYWFGPGGPNDFTAGNSLRFQLVNLQVIFWQCLHSSVAANAIADTLFIAGLVVWIWAMRRGRLGTLGLASLLALSFLSFYHSVTDVSILLLGFCWVLSNEDVQLRWTKLFLFLLLLGLSVPSHSLLLRLEPHLSQSATSSWWWTGIIAPWFIWNMLLLNVALIYAVVRSSLNAFPEIDQRYSNN